MLSQFSLCKKLNLLNSLCFPRLEKLTAKFPVLPVPWPSCSTYPGHPSKVDTVKSVSMALLTSSKLKSFLLHDRSTTPGRLMSPSLYTMKKPLKITKKMLRSLNFIVNQCIAKGIAVDFCELALTLGRNTYWQSASVILDRSEHSKKVPFKNRKNCIEINKVCNLSDYVMPNIKTQ